MRSAIIAGCIVCSGLLPSAHATDANQAYAVHGAGRMTCEAYVKERAEKSARYQMVIGWLDGYVTAANRFTTDTYDALSFETAELVAYLMENHCKQRPQDRLYAIINALVTGVREDRIRMHSPRISAKVGEHEFNLYAEVLERMQRKLAELGFYAGEPEADFGERTRAALHEFQQQNKLKPTGYPDQITLWRLLRQPVTGRSATPSAATK